MTSKQVLVVEDDPVSRDGLTDLLRDEGHHVVAVCTGAEAILEFQRSRPDVVLLDYWLPDATGVQVLRGIREVDRACPVIVISASADLHAGEDQLCGRETEATQAGASAYVAKPVDLESLLRVIDRVCS